MEEIKKEVAEMINKSVEETAKNQNAQVEELKKSIDEKQKNADEALKSLKQEVEDLKKDNAEKTETIKSLGERLTEKQEVKPVAMSAKARRAIYKEAIKAEIKKNLEEIKALNGTDVKKEYRMETAIEKAAGTVLRTNITDGNGNAVFGQYSPIEPGVTRVQLPRLVMRDLVTIGSVEGSYARWTEATAGEGTPASTAEGADKPQRDQDWVLKEAKVEKLAVFTKVSEETLEDIEWASEEIAADLVEQLMQAEDKYILGVINTAAPTFDVSGTVFASAIPSANYMDALRVACAQVAAGNFDADTVILNPADAAMMDLEKDAMGRYLWVKQDDRVWYLRVVESNNMTQGNFIVGDFRRANYRIRKDITMYAGREKDDLTKNLFTIVFELRGVAYIKTNFKPAFVAGAFSTAISAIDYVEQQEGE